MDLYEYQARDLFEKYEVPVLAGIVADTPEEVRAAAEKIGGVVVVKAQVKAGGRGKAGGVKVVKTPEEAEEAARAILDRPASFPEVVAALFDADADLEPGAAGAPLDVMDMTVGDVQVQIRRSAPFTATEFARGSAMADLVSDVLRREQHHPAIALSDNRRMGAGSSPEYHVEGSQECPSVVATIDGTTVGVATVRPADGDETDVRAVELEVDPAWQRRGIGTRLLSDAARLAAGLGVDAILLSARSDNQAVMPMMMAAGMRGRIRMAGDVLTVRIGVRDLKPLSLSQS